MNIKSFHLLSIREPCCLWACYLYHLIVPTWVGICFNICDLMPVVQLTVLYLAAILPQYCRFVIKFLDIHLLL
jgi:hypothetical protein